MTAPIFQGAKRRLGVYLLNAATGKVIGFIPVAHSHLFGQAVFARKYLLIGGGPQAGLTAYKITTAAVSKR